MKRVLKTLCTTCLCFMSLACAAPTSNVTTNGNILTAQVNDVKIHTYSAGGANSVVVESDKLVIFDTFGGSDADAGFKAFVNSLNKPVESIIISHVDSHHWIGADKLFPGVQLYSIDAVGIKKSPEGATLPVRELFDGTNSFNDVRYEFVTYRELGSWVIKMPQQKVAMVHHLGYPNFHVPLPPLDTRLDILSAMKKDGYSQFIGGHGTAMEAGKFISIVEKYNKFVTKAVETYKTPAEAKKAIVAEYPDWGGDFLLDIFLPLFYK